MGTLVLAAMLLLLVVVYVWMAWDSAGGDGNGFTAEEFNEYLVEKWKRGE